MDETNTYIVSYDKIDIKDLLDISAIEKVLYNVCLVDLSYIQISEEILENINKSMIDMMKRMENESNEKDLKFRYIISILESNPNTNFRLNYSKFTSEKSDKSDMDDVIRVDDTFIYRFSLKNKISNKEKERITNIISGWQFPEYEFKGSIEFIEKNILLKRKSDDLYLGNVWLFINNKYPEYCGMYGLKSSIVNYITNEHGILKLLLKEVKKYALLHNRKFIIVPWPLIQMEKKLIKMGFKKYKAYKEYNEEAMFIKPYGRVGMDYYKGSVDLL